MVEMNAQERIIISADGNCTSPIIVARNRKGEGWHIRQSRSFLLITPAQFDALADALDVLGETDDGPRLGRIFSSKENGK